MRARWEKRPLVTADKVWECCGEGGERRVLHWVLGEGEGDEGGGARREGYEEDVEGGNQIVGDVNG